MKIALQALVALNCLFVTVACGEAVPEINEGGLSDRCPSVPPSTGASCSSSGLQCEYGDHNETSCNTLATCEGEQWNVRTPAVDACTTNPLPTGCPDTQAKVPVGQACPGLFGTVCQYASGTCGCTLPRFGPYPEDAAGRASWICDTPPTGCPTPRPKAGTECQNEGMSCGYGACALPSGTTMRCVSGLWRTELVPCPG